MRIVKPFFLSFLMQSLLTTDFLELIKPESRGTSKFTCELTSSVSAHLRERIRESSIYDIIIDSIKNFCNGCKRLRFQLESIFESQWLTIGRSKISISLWPTCGVHQSHEFRIVCSRSLDIELNGTSVGTVPNFILQHTSLEVRGIAICLPQRCRSEKKVEKHIC
jgi:hypothetical protein